MRPTEVDRLREKAESVAGFSRPADAARATVERHLEGVELGEHLTGPFVNDVEAFESPHLRAAKEIHAAHERATFNVTDLGPRPVVVVPSPESEMAGHIAAMRKELAESNRREAEIGKRADEAEGRANAAREQAEKRERLMIGLTAVAALIAALQAAASIF